MQIIQNTLITRMEYASIYSNYLKYLSYLFKLFAIRLDYSNSLSQIRDPTREASTCESGNASICEYSNISNTISIFDHAYTPVLTTRALWTCLLICKNEF